MEPVSPASLKLLQVLQYDLRTTPSEKALCIIVNELATKLNFLLAHFEYGEVFITEDDDAKP
jgi:hypothetical protein